MTDSRIQINLPSATRTQLKQDAIIPMVHNGTLSLQYLSVAFEPGKQAMNLFLRRLVMLQTLKVINVSVGDSLFVLCETQTVHGVGKLQPATWRRSRSCSGQIPSTQSPAMESGLLLHWVESRCRVSEQQNGVSRGQEVNKMCVLACACLISVVFAFTMVQTAVYLLGEAELKSHII